MNRPGDIRLFRQAAEGGRHGEPAEYIDRHAFGGGNQVAGDQHAEQQQIQRQVAELGGGAGQVAVVGRRRRRRADEAPEQAQDHGDEQEDADALVDFRGAVIPGVVVVQLDHPQTDAEQREDRQGAHPVQKQTDQTVAGGRIAPLHRQASFIDRGIKISGKNIERK
ncbi:hypothetical protein D9M73_161540 [compost metagenome]